MSAIRSFRVVSMFATALLAACAAPAEEGDGESGGQAIGERWRSPIEEGVYDSADATITVRNGLQGQDADYDGDDLYLDGSVELKDGRAVVVSRIHSFALTPAGKDIDVALTRWPNPAAPKERFTRRPVDAVKGTYRAPNGATIVVEASNDAELTLVVTPAGDAKAIRTKATRGFYLAHTPSGFESSDFDDCSISTRRVEGEYGLSVVDRGGCVIAGQYPLSN